MENLPIHPFTSTGVGPDQPDPRQVRLVTLGAKVYPSLRHLNETTALVLKEVAMMSPPAGYPGSTQLASPVKYRQKCRELRSDKMKKK